MRSQVRVSLGSSWTARWNSASALSRLPRSRNFWAAARYLSFFVTTDRPANTESYRLSTACKVALCRSSSHPLHQVGIEAASDEIGVLEEPAMEIDVGPAALDDQL